MLRGWDDAAEGMTLVISVMRVHQLFLARVDRVLRPLSLTFSRYEVLALLSFTRRGSLPMNKITKRLQVHATSTTNSVEAAGLARRLPHPEDGRTTLVEITESGRELVARATDALNSQVFRQSGLAPEQVRDMLASVSQLRTFLEESTSDPAG
jgi:DNA-binding MarR family transcriptional regulator